ncbi:MAG: acetyl-CoA carboxylase biotin carboxylase subunit [Candidatus Magnetobacterium sp. LHC-1]|uniref:Biotin carboxylase n=1 Tax=Candidatus Magnetobacterium casense TaxID=1455061 RepID=A0ABS6S119_9BACT|nr:acetyl-CoA carboxylase biotin carboxylase subunit [Candidatus Magnetobacterium casensis]MBF0608874.1 acetyl-CoA carboxylase biotin carboxylase subunit [Nitrospirota bacterium]MBV6342506.1 acetyl-CoA carboxylase biotin carboxylase subunit [Candidatus Magnetobacterium casensis]
MPLFKKILIANRGEIAIRVIRACRELEIGTVAVYSEIDRESMHVKLADEAICVGPARASDSYLNIPAILSAAEVTDSEAIHPGYGFLSENPQFADACRKSGIVFIGPTPENIRLGGNKARARQIMKRHGIPVVPGSDGAIDDMSLAMKIARKIGFPVIIKASAGGGGKGMRVVHEESQMPQALTAAQNEALAAFGNGELYIEKYFTLIRHIEVQIAVDNKGETLQFGERDCSVQRRHQKLIEESPSPIINERLREKLGKYAIKAAEALKYRNVGTVEFIFDKDENFYFMEINTRVQVEHPVTEMVTGIDVIKEQIRLAAGLPLSVKQKNLKLVGHSIECRINAEDPFTFIPSPGKIGFYYQPGGPGVRVDTYVYGGCTIPSQYDSLIAKLITYGSNRHEAIERMRRALGEFKIEGIKTTIPFHRTLLSNADFLAGRFDTGYLERPYGQPT